MNGIDKSPVLSICIPSYNRSQHVFTLVSELLRYPGYELEVIVLDNCSTDGTENLLRTINDKRFSYIKNSINIGGILNIVNVFSYAKGHYSMLLLDRDKIKIQYIKPIIDILVKEKNIVLGYTSSEYNTKEPFIVFDKGFSSVLNMAYLSKHPSGNFYKTSVFKQLKIVSNFNEKFKQFGFITELINSEASFFGNSMIINIPVISPSFVDAKEDFMENKSHSYQLRENLYFFPSQRIIEFTNYFNDASKLNISKKHKQLLYKKIYIKGLLSSTYEYKKNLSNPEFCSHYRIESIKISFFELFKNDYNFSMSFLKINIPLNMFHKLYICFIAHFMLLTHLFIKLILTIRHIFLNRSFYKTRS